MFLVFSKTMFFSPVIIAVMVLLTSGDVFGSLSEIPMEDTMSYFHEHEIKAQVVEKFSVDALTKKVHFEVYVINAFGEPHKEPLKLVIGYQIEDGKFGRLSRVFDKKDEASYCDFSRPQVMDRNSLIEEVGLEMSEALKLKSLSSPGEYLVVPVFKASEEAGGCDTQKTQFEVFSIEDIVKTQI